MKIRGTRLFRGRMRLPCLLWAGLLLLLPACGRSADLSVYTQIEKAQALFNRAATAEEFLQAAAIYRQVHESGFVNGALLYNMGNAYMQADQRGYAVAAYRQAQRYRPRDPFLEANLKYALGAGAVVEGRRSILDHLLFWKDWLSYPEKYLCTLIAAGLTLITAFIMLFRRRKVVWKRVTWILLVSAAMLAFSAGYDTYRYEWVEYGVVVEDDVVARKGNSENFEPALMEALPQGTEFQVEDSQGDWLLIRLDRLNEGCWIRAKSAVIY